MMLTWKYTLPAFVVPFMFTLSPEGLGVLLQGSWRDVVTASLAAAVGIAALAVGFGGWMRGPASLPERGLLVAAGLLLLHRAAWVTALGRYCCGAVLALWTAFHESPGQYLRVSHCMARGSVDAACAF